MASEVFYPESLAEFKARMELGEKGRDYYALIKDLRFPPGDPRRYDAQPDSAEAEHE